MERQRKEGKNRGRELLGENMRKGKKGKLKERYGRK